MKFDYMMPAFVLAFSVVLSTQAHAQSTTKQSAETKPAHWVVSCSNRANPKILTCSMGQSIVQSKTRQRIVAANILRDSAGAFFMRLQLPHGLDLAKGVNIAVDKNNSAPHPIRTSDANGSYARIPLGNDMLQAMRAGNKLVVSVSAANGKTISLQLSLAGFSDALALMTR